MDDNNAETYKRNGLDVAIWYEYNPENPLDWTTPEERRSWYALKHSRYDLPYEIEADTDVFNDWRELAESVTGKGGELEGKVYMSVNWYEHSGIAISLQNTTTPSDRWDAGIAGVVFGDTADDIKASFVDYRAYVEGDIYGYTVTNPKNDEIVDSCGGYYGLDYCRDEANNAADAYKHPHDAAYAKNARELHR